jgi:hypothetical protein
MGIDCRTITADFQEQIKDVKENSMNIIPCNNGESACRIMYQQGGYYEIVDEVIERGQEYSFDLPKSYAFYVGDFVLLAYFDVKEQRLYY